MKFVQETQNLLITLEKTVSKCDMDEDLKAEKLKEIEAMKKTCEDLESERSDLAAEWRKLEEEIAEVDAWLVKKSRELSKVPMTEVHFDKLHKIFQVSLTF